MAAILNFKMSAKYPLEMLFMTQILLGIFSIVSGSNVTVLVFQGNNELTTQSRATLQLNSTSTMDTDEPRVIRDLTICLWFKIKYFRENTYLFSYATSNNNNNELNLGIKPSSVFFAVGGEYVRFYKSKEHLKNGHQKEHFEYVPDNWYHICLIINSSTRKAAFLQNGELFDTSKFTAKPLSLNGSLVLGQETDKYKGGYRKEQSFSGYIADLQLYDRALKIEEATALASCASKDKGGNIVNWESAKWHLMGPVQELKLPRDHFCSAEQRFRITVFPEKRIRTQAKKFCSVLKMTMALPKDEQQNKKLYSASSPFAGTCQPSNSMNGFLWLGAHTHKNKTTNEYQWMDHNGSLLNYSKFEDSDQRYCAILKIPPHAGMWNGGGCNTKSYCMACREHQPVVLQLRGLCEEDYKANFFRFHTKEYGEKPLFRGFTRYEIVLDSSKEWQLVDLWENTTLATHIALDDTYPLGLHNWTLTTDYGICQKKKDSYHLMSLSACFSWEWSCDDSSCVNLSQRCDLRVDCSDASDEKFCDKLRLPEEYIPRLPPPANKPGPLKLNMTINVTSFTQINIRDMKITIDYEHYISWYDARLGYQNLKENKDLNFIEAEKVWTPTLEFMNAEFPSTHRTDPLIQVLKRGEIQEDDHGIAKYELMYSGSDNPLIIHEKIHAPISCNMDMKMFPFDTQHCSLHIRLTSASTFLTWGQLEVLYSGERMMTEYMVQDPTIHMRVESSYSIATVEFSLERRYHYYLTSLYIPAVMLLLMSYASLWCPREAYDLRVMMSLTTMLVLFSLYQQMSNDLPRTSYIKSIDIWCFFALSYIFSQVVFHVVIEIPHSRCFWSKVSADNVSERSVTRRMFAYSHPILLARVVYAGVLILFLIIYWSVYIS